MRKNNGARTILSGIYASCEIEGGNLDRFINTLRVRGVNLYRVKKISRVKMSLAVKRADGKKLFAIAKELCYNIKNFRYAGILSPLYYLAKNLGVLIGAIIFCVGAVAFNDVVLSIDCYGTGAVLYREVEELLNEKGVCKFSRFSSINLKELSNTILANSPNLSFVECQKSGNHLKINLILSQTASGTLTGTCEKMVSADSGEIVKIKVYRGLSKVSVGDLVDKGAVLVEAIQTDGGNIAGVIALVTIRVTENREYLLDGDNAEGVATAIALTESVNQEPIDIKVKKTKNGEKYLYTVSLVFEKTYFVG